MFTLVENLYEFLLNLLNVLSAFYFKNYDNLIIHTIIFFFRANMVVITTKFDQ